MGYWNWSTYFRSIDSRRRYFWRTKDMATCRISRINWMWDKENWKIRGYMKKHKLKNVLWRGNFLWNKWVSLDISFITGQQTSIFGIHGPIYGQLEGSSPISFSLKGFIHSTSHLIGFLKRNFWYMMWIRLAISSY